MRTGDRRSLTLTLSCPLMLFSCRFHRCGGCDGLHRERVGASCEDSERRPSADRAAPALVGSGFFGSPRNSAKRPSVCELARAPGIAARARPGSRCSRRPARHADDARVEDHRLVTHEQGNSGPEERVQDGLPGAVQDLRLGERADVAARRVEKVHAVASLLVEAAQVRRIAFRGSPARLLRTFSRRRTKGRQSSATQPAGGAASSFVQGRQHALSGSLSQALVARGLGKKVDPSSQPKPSSRTEQSSSSVRVTITTSESSRKKAFRWLSRLRIDASGWSGDSRRPRTGSGAPDRPESGTRLRASIRSRNRRLSRLRSSSGSR